MSPRGCAIHVRNPFIPSDPTLYGHLTPSHRSQNELMSVSRRSIPYKNAPVDLLLTRLFWEQMVLHSRQMRSSVDVGLRHEPEGYPAQVISKIKVYATLQADLQIYAKSGQSTPPEPTS